MCRTSGASLTGPVRIVVRGHSVLQKFYSVLIPSQHILATLLLAATGEEEILCMYWIKTRQLPRALRA